MHVPGIRAADKKRCRSASPASAQTRLAVWRQMEAAVRLGLARSIGVSTFDAAKLGALLDANLTVPAVCQVEYQPHHHDEQLRRLCEANQIRIVAYSSIRATLKGRKSSPLGRIAQRLGVSEARVALDWAVAQGVAVIPRSTSRDHLVANLAVGSEALGLTADELSSLSAAPALQFYAGLTREFREPRQLSQSSHERSAAAASWRAEQDELVALLTPCTNACSNLTRYGRSIDGGYQMCQDVLRPPHGLAAAFSLGIKGRDSWGNAISRALGIPVYEYDCYNTNPPASVSGADLHFEPTCVGPVDEVQPDGRRFRSVETLVAASVPRREPSASRQRSDLLLKMDVEGKEWPIFLGIPRRTLGRFRQMTLELHGVAPDGRACRKMSHGRRQWSECWGDAKNVSEALRFLRRLDEHFVLVGNHGNNWWSAHEVAGRVMPDFTELTYVHRRALPRGFTCTPMAAADINRHHLPNTPKAPEIETLSPWSGAQQGMPSASAAEARLALDRVQKRAARPRPPTAGRRLLGLGHSKQAQARERLAPSLPGSAWAPLEGASISEVLRQHPDALGALSAGEVPAIVLRGHMPPRDAAELVARLPRPGASVWRLRGSNYSTLGVDLKSHLALAAGPKDMVRATQRWGRYFLARGLSSAMDSLHAALRGLAAGRRVGYGKDAASNATLSPGIFRAHGQGNEFPPHFDTLHSHRWSQRACERPAAALPAAAARSPAQQRRPLRLHQEHLSRFPDLLRFDEQFSALLVLQRPEDGSDFDVTLHDADWTSLLSDCALEGVPHAIGVNLGASWSKRQPEAAAKARVARVRLAAGDFYVFNSNRVHEVDRVQGRARITLGTFVGYSPDDVRIWA